MTILAIDDTPESLGEPADNLQADYVRNHPAGNRLLARALPVRR